MNKITLIPTLKATLTISILSTLLVACGASTPVKQAPAKPGSTINSVPNVEPIPEGQAETPKTEQAKPPSPAITTPAKPGGYYLDDGPEDNPPANLDSVPDATPKSEPLLKRANKPYYALNKSYQPMTEYVPYKKRGLASWYGKRFHGQKTSTGEVYDMYAMTAAHTILPIPSYARVTNVENKKSVVVRVNDRGPFHSDRIVDLSYAAAHKLGLLTKGSGMVEVEAIDTRAQSKTLVKPTPETNTAKENMVDAPDTKIAPLLIDGASAPQGEAKGFYVQAGAFSAKTNGDELVEKLAKENLAERQLINNWYNGSTYRVRLGPFENKKEAEQLVAKIKSSLKLNTFIINQP